LHGRNWTRQKLFKRWRTPKDNDHFVELFHKLKSSAARTAE